jgi:hypothetical protein
MEGKYAPIPLGDVPAAAVLVEAVLLAGLVILLPLRKLAPVVGRRRGQGRLLIYFSLLGVGFIIFEIVLLQRFILLVGSPALSVALVIGTLLMFAGIGSAVVSRWAVDRRGLAGLAFALICLFALVYGVWLEDWVTAAHELTLSARCLVGVGLLAPLGLLLGVPFPLGLRHAHRRHPQLVPWAWALNGYMTVVGTTAVSIVIQFLGYRLMFLLGGLVYLGAALCFAALSRPAGTAERPEAHDDVPVAAGVSAG